jgi:phosphonate transport system substrate-binding protein
MMNRRNFIWYSLLFLASCQGVTSRKKIDLDNLKFAITDVKGLEKLDQDYGTLKQVLSEILAVNIEFFPVESYTAAISALQLNQVNLVLAGPSEYVLIKEKTNAIPIIAITRPNYFSVIAIPKNSPIKSLSDLKGKKIAMSDIGSTSGHLGPTKLLINGGLNPKTDLEVLMLGDEGSIEAIKTGKVDAWAGSATDYNDDLKTDDDQFPIIAQSELLPSDIFIAASQIAPETIEQIRTIMLENQETVVNAIASTQSKYRNSELIPAEDSDYDIIREVFDIIGETI